MKTALALLACLTLSIPIAASAADPSKGAAKDPVTGTRFKADADMKSVLEAHAALGPKPIEKLDVAQARQQPTFADAVMAAAKQKGKDTAVPGVTHVDRQVLAAALKRAGVRVDHKLYEGATHEFFGAAAVVKDAKEAQAYGGKALKRAMS